MVKERQIRDAEIVFDNISPVKGYGIYQLHSRKIYIIPNVKFCF